MDIVKANTDRMSAMYFYKIKETLALYQTDLNHSAAVWSTLHTNLQFRFWHGLKVGLEGSIVWAEKFQRLRNRSHWACGRTNLLPETDRFKRQQIELSKLLVCTKLQQQYSIKLILMLAHQGKQSIRHTEFNHTSQGWKNWNKAVRLCHRGKRNPRTESGGCEYLMLSRASFCTPGSASCARRTYSSSCSLSAWSSSDCTDERVRRSQGIRSKQEMTDFRADSPDRRHPSSCPSP